MEVKVADSWPSQSPEPNHLERDVGNGCPHRREDLGNFWKIGSDADNV